MAKIIEPKLRTKIRLEGAEYVISRILTQIQLGVKVDEKYLAQVLREIRQEKRKYED